MKYILASMVLLVSQFSTAQSAGFPSAWSGKWKGDLFWYKTGSSIPQKVEMELRIEPTKNSDQYNWQIIYGGNGKDERPYTIIPKDSTGTHWAIDEHNGIILDQYFVGNKLSGAFTVLNNTIMNSYELTGDSLRVEFYAMNTKPVTVSGNGTKKSPKVDSYRIGSYQKAILFRQK